MFERFTDDARVVVIPLAQRQARQWPISDGDGKPVLTAMHMLLALASTERGPATQVLRAHGITIDAIRGVLPGRMSGLDAEALATLGIDLVAVREAIEATFGQGALDVGGVARGRIAFGQSGKQALAHAVRAAVRAGARRVGTQYLLHGVLNAGDRMVTGVLAALNVDQGELGAEVAALMGPAAA